MAETSFQVTYDGPALASGRMPVRDLAPALLALGDLFADASVVLQPDRKPVALSIQATNEGSFVVRLILEAKDRLIDIFGGDVVNALINLKEVILGTGGLLWLIKIARGRRPSKTEELPEPGMIKLTFEDGEAIEVSAEVLRLFQTVAIRRKVREVVEPLHRQGIERVAFTDERVETISISTGDVESFEIPDDEVRLGANQLSMIVSIANVAFVEGNKWRLTDGDNTFYASIDDPAFLSRVNDGVEAFRKGDMLRVRMEIVQSQRAGELHTDHHVTEVVEHIPTPMQLQLGTSEPDPT